MWWQKWPRWGWALIALFGWLWVVSCSGGDADALPKQQNRPALPVLVGKVEQKDVPLTVTAVGDVEAYATVIVKARVSGPVVAVHFKEGQEVKEGDLLFTLDEEPFRLSLQETQARLARDQALARKAQADLNRNVILADKAIISRQDFEALQATARSLEATVRADQVAVEILKAQLGYCRIKAPISGRTGSLQIDRGNLVKAADDNNYLVMINQIEPINVTFTVPERYLDRIKRTMSKGDLTVTVQVPDGEGDQPLTGKVTFVDNQVDQTTGTILLKAEFQNKVRRLWPGQFANVTLNLEVTAGAVVVPSAAVQVGQSGQYVFVVKPDETVDLRPVVVAREAGPETIITKGLAPGDIVVTDGQLRLTPGARISVRGGPGEGAPAGGLGQAK